jgi:hypothetical protein
VRATHAVAEEVGGCDVHLRRGRRKRERERE